jgi:magnesium transporter
MFTNETDAMSKTSQPSHLKANTVTARVWQDGEVVEEKFPFEQISDYLADDKCVLWVDLGDPDDELLHRLAGELDLDINSVNDAIDDLVRPKATRYPTHKFLTAYSAKLSEDGVTIATQRISAFVLRNGLITIRPDEAFDLEPVLKRWDETSDLISKGVPALVHGLLDVIVDSHFDAVQALDDAIEGLEDDLFDQSPQNNDVQRRSFTLRKSLVQLRRVVLPMREVVGALLRHNNEDPKHDAALDSYFQDLYDHVLRASEWTESLRDMIGSIFETNLSLSDIRMNTIMKKLTSWAAIIAVPTAITGFYGQNVPYPGFNHHDGFYVSSGLMIVLVLGLYTSFKKKDWL